MAKVRIVGAGFSGLTLAYYLSQRGVAVEVFEQNPDVGGLIHTLEHPLGLVETAANALLWSPQVQALFDDLKLELLTPQDTAKKRFVFHQQKARRWPFNLLESLKLIVRLVLFIFWPKLRIIKRFESVEQYICRVFNKTVLTNLIEPALKGVYAGDVKQMSARLILGRLIGFHVKDVDELTFVRSRGKRRGSVSPKNGMGTLIQALKAHLIQRGVVFHFSESPKELLPTTVLATSFWSAAQLLKTHSPELSQKLSEIESLGLVTATLFYPKANVKLQGFGVVFKRGEGVRSLGVLFNECIFKNRSLEHSETWILGGAEEPALVSARDEELLKNIEQDREKLYGVRENHLSCQITRWPKALPHYTLALENILESLEVPPGIHLHGNYLGRIGLSQILDRSRLLAEKIAKKESGYP